MIAELPGEAPYTVSADGIHGTAQSAIVFNSQVVRSHKPYQKDAVQFHQQGCEFKYGVQTYQAYLSNDVYMDYMTGNFAYALQEKLARPLIHYFEYGVRREHQKLAIRLLNWVRIVLKDWIEGKFSNLPWAFCLLDLWESFLGQTEKLAPDLKLISLYELDFEPTTGIAKIDRGRFRS